MSDASATLVVVEDEPPIRRFLRASLTAEGFRVVEASTVKGGLRSVTQERPDLILLDLGLPDGDGVSIIHSVRQWSTMPIIVLSARGEEKSKIIALDAGADDYLTKPFGVGELLARIRVALRHARRLGAAEVDEGTFEMGPLRIDFIGRRVYRGDEAVQLTKTEFDLLAVLARNAGKVLTHRHLLREVWGPHAAEEPHYVRVFMANLRKKLEDEPSRPKYLLTEQGIGYRFRTDDYPGR
jgi:two-component system KDP operon response regulator KdpE